jgi:hypothetical protein
MTSMTETLTTALTQAEADLEAARQDNDIEAGAQIEAYIAELRADLELIDFARQQWVRPLR